MIRINLNHKTKIFIIVIYANDNKSKKKPNSTLKSLDPIKGLDCFTYQMMLII